MEQYDIIKADTILFAIRAYTFILPFNKEIRFYRFANMIADVYDINEPHNKEIVSLLRAHPYNSVTRRLGHISVS